MLDVKNTNQTPNWLYTLFTKSQTDWMVKLPESVVNIRWILTIVQ